MPARVVACLTPGCGGRAEYLQTKGIYRCDDCGGRFEPHEIPSEPLRNGITTFHGRMAERAVLEGALEAAVGGRCQVALIHGPPGIGKTALMRALYHELAAPDRDPQSYWPDVVGELAELSRDAPRQRTMRQGLDLPFLWLAGYAPSPLSGSTQPLYTWQRALEGLRNLPLAPTGASRATGVARAAGRGLLDLGAGVLGIGLLKTLLETSVEVGRALGRSAGDTTGMEEVGGSVARSMERDVARTVERLATHPDVPVLVVSLDDLQWADDATAAAIVAVCRQAGPGSRLLLLLGYRDTEVESGASAIAAALPTLHRYAGEASFDLVDVPLEELDPANTEALVRGYFPDAAADLLGWLGGEIGGTPFYLHQFCALLLERGDVNPSGTVRTPGGVPTLRQAVHDGHLPVRLEAVLRERLARLESRQRQLLAYGSVEGRTFTDAFLERVLQRVEPTGTTEPGTQRDAIRRDLDDCERLHRLIRSAITASADSWPFEFMHDLLHVASGQQLSPALRATCLSALTEWLLDSWRTEAFATYPLTERRRILDRLLSLIPIDRRSEARMTDTEYVRLAIDAAKVFRLTGSIDAAIDALTPVLTACRDGSLDPDDAAAGAYHDQASDLYVDAYRWSDAEAALQSALLLHDRRARSVVDVDALEDLIGTHQRLGDLRLRRGELVAAEASYSAARDAADRHAELAAEERITRVTSLTFGRLGDLHARRGALGRAETEYRRSLRIHERLAQTDDDPDVRQELAIAHCDLGDLLARRGQLDDAERHYRHALEVEVRAGSASEGQDVDVVALANLSGTYSRLGDLALRRGNLAEAESWYQQALAISERLVADEDDHAAKYSLSVAIAKLADVVLRRGGLDEAERLYRRDLALSTELVTIAPSTETRMNLNATLARLGILLERRGNLDEAETYYRRDLTLNERLAHDEHDTDTQTYLSAALSNLGSLLERRGNLHEAEALYRRDLTLNERLAHDQHDTDSQRNLSRTIASLGRLLERRGNLDEAEAFYRRDLALSERLAQDDHDTGTQSSLSIALSNLGQLLERRGNLDEAEALYRHDLTLSERLAGDESNTAAQRDLSCAHVNLGDLAIRRSDLGYAMQSYRRAYDIRAKLAGDESDVDAQVDLIACLHRLALVTERIGEHGGGERWRQEAEAVVAILPESSHAWLLPELERCQRLAAALPHRRPGA